jgi:CubicO group peptidase (beta-lactamase class C family)
VQELDRIDEWSADHAAAACVTRRGDVIAVRGPVDHPFALASVTKILVGYSTLVAVEEGSIGLDDPAGPDGSTVRHLLTHASRLAPDGSASLAAPETRRIYSNAGFEVLGATLEAATGMTAAEYLDEAVCAPLDLSATRLEGSAASGAVSTVADLARFVAELLAPTLVAPDTLATATTVAFPRLDGVLPASAGSRPTTGGSVSNCATRRSRTGQAQRTRRQRSDTSAKRARWCGSTRSRISRSCVSRIARSAHGPPPTGRSSPTPFSPRITLADQPFHATIF